MALADGTVLWNPEGVDALFGYQTPLVPFDGAGEASDTPIWIFVEVLGALSRIRPAAPPPPPPQLDTFAGVAPAVGLSAPPLPPLLQPEPTHWPPFAFDVDCWPSCPDALGHGTAGATTFDHQRRRKPCNGQD